VTPKDNEFRADPIGAWKVRPKSKMLPAAAVPRERTQAPPI